MMKTETILFILFAIGVAISPLHSQTIHEASSISNPIPEGYEISGSETEFGEVNADNSTTVEVVPLDLPVGSGIIGSNYSSYGSRRNHSASAENESTALKPIKIKKKILISNLKNITEKVVSPSDKYDKQIRQRTTGDEAGAADGRNWSRKFPVVDSPKNSTSAEVAPVEDRELKPKDKKRNDTGDLLQNDTLQLEAESRGDPFPGELRSFPDGNVIRRTNDNYKYLNRRNKVTTTSTENYGVKYTTNSYVFYTLAEVQKSVNNNHLSVSEDFERSTESHSISSIVPFSGTTPASAEGEPSSISKLNPVKNLVRMRNGYYTPTEQTGWIPIVPLRSPTPEVRSEEIPGNGTTPLATARPSRANHSTGFTIWRRLTTTEPMPLSSIAAPAEIRPTERIQSTTQVSNAIPALDADEETVESFDFQKVNRTVSKPSGSESHERGANRKIQNDIQKLNKNRGSIKFRPLAVDSTTVSADNRKTLKRNGTIWGNVTVVPMEAIPNVPLDASTVGNSSAPTEPSVGSVGTTGNNAETVVEGLKTVSTTPAEVTRLKNIAKVQVLKNVISDGLASDNPMSIFKFSETDALSGQPETTTEATPSLTPKEDITSNHPVTHHPVEVMITVVENVTSGKMVEPSTESPTFEELSGGTTTVPNTTHPASPADYNQGTTLSQEILRLSTISSNIITTIPSHISLDSENRENYSNFMTTVKDRDGLTTTETTTTTTTVAETEKDALSITHEIPPETTTSVSTDSDRQTEVETTTEVAFDDVPMPPKEMAPEMVRPVPTTTASLAETETETEPYPADLDLDAVKQVPEEDVSVHEHHPPVHPGVRHDITEETVPAYLKLTVEASSWEELCRLKEDLHNAIIRMLDGMNVTSDSVVFLNLNDKNCREKIEESKRNPPSNGPVFLPVNMFLMNENGDFDKNLSEAFLNVWGQYGLDFELPIRKVDFLTPLGLYDLPNDSSGVSVIVAIVISCVAGLCVILLGILFVIMKRRQKRFNYGQRCTPVSLDAYSLDSVSIHNSVRRKGIRTSKRSYGNAAFDDPEMPSHSMNFAGLANFSTDKEQLFEEFNIIPQVSPKTDELPAGAETKNRYANVIPLPETRVHLSIKDGDALSDYINANYVRGLKGREKLYIACQAPMDSTVEDFWRMVWEQQSKVIIMLTDFQENGVEKCSDYLPPNEVTDNLRLFGDFQITMKQRDVKEKYIISYLKIKNMEANLWREVTHLWYLGWPEQGVPSEANSLIAFLIEARSQMKSQSGSGAPGPAIVHCSPGTGRTGTVIACDLCIREFEQTRMVDIPKCVFNLRKDRAGAVQTKDQYAFIYQVLNLYATKLTGGGLESI